MIEAAITYLLSVFAITQTGLLAVFIVAFVSATLLPMGSEPMVFAMIKAHPDLFWQTIFVASLANTLGGVVNYGLGWGAKSAFARERQSKWFGWLERYGAKTMLLAWLPVIGDPICVLGGWLRLPFWPCVCYMAIGKLCRYLLLTGLLLQVPSSWWQWLLQLG